MSLATLFHLVRQYKAAVFAASNFPAIFLAASFFPLDLRDQKSKPRTTKRNLCIAHGCRFGGARHVWKADEAIVSWMA
jgi:hypothetical protein